MSRFLSAPPSLILGMKKISGYVIMFYVAEHRTKRKEEISNREIDNKKELKEELGQFEI